MLSSARATRSFASLPDSLSWSARSRARLCTRQISRPHPSRSMGLYRRCRVRLCANAKWSRSVYPVSIFEARISLREYQLSRPISAAR